MCWSEVSNRTVCTFMQHERKLVVQQICARSWPCMPNLRPACRCTAGQSSPIAPLSTKRVTRSRWHAEDEIWSRARLLLRMFSRKLSQPPSKTMQSATKSKFSRRREEPTPKSASSLSISEWWWTPLTAAERRCQLRRREERVPMVVCYFPWPADRSIRSDPRTLGSMSMNWLFGSSMWTFACAKGCSVTKNGGSRWWSSSLKRWETADASTSFLVLSAQRYMTTFKDDATPEYHTHVYAPVAKLEAPNGFRKEPRILNSRCAQTRRILSSCQRPEDSVDEQSLGRIHRHVLPCEDCIVFALIRHVLQETFAP